MPITIDGTESISGLSAGGLPDLTVVTADIAAGAVTQAKRSEDLTQGTAIATTSGTVINIDTAVPSWVRRITVAYSGVSLSGSAHTIIQLGSGSYATSGYASTGAYAGSGNQAGVASATNGTDTFDAGSINILYE
jgi:hypothetical protein